MNDDLRACAERVLEPRARYSSHEVPVYIGHAPPPAGDDVTLARAWLAEHPADDAEPIGEPWLPSAGWEWDEELGAWVLTGRHFRVSLSRSVMATDHWTLQYETDFYWPIPLVVRGDVRGLLAILGVTPKEPS